MKINIKLDSNIGANLGPNFTLTADTGSLDISTATRAELTSINGVTVTPSDTDLSTITVTSTGLCTNSVVLTISDPES